jgi:6-pyruvoyltetrahydropterin/6-carboxytetrahydropterin synthase
MFHRETLAAHMSAAHTHAVPGRNIATRHGHNYEVCATLAGPIGPGRVLAEAADLAAALDSALARFDHQELDLALAGTPASPAALAAALWSAMPAHLPAGVRLKSIGARQADGAGGWASASGVWATTRAVFSAAHRTHAPRLTEAENQALYGICNNPAGHGHNYRAIIWHAVDTIVARPVWAALDHRNLSVDVPALHGRNVVTEAVAAHLADQVPGAGRVRVWETDAFYAEFWPARNDYRLGRRRQFSAAHRLYDPALSPEVNRQRYGRCGTPGTHGHDFNVEIVVRGKLDPMTETAFDLGELDRAAEAVLAPLDHADLDDAVPALRSGYNTPARLAVFLWEGLAPLLGPALCQVGVAAQPGAWSWTGSDDDE